MTPLERSIIHAPGFHLRFARVFSRPSPKPQLSQPSIADGILNPPSRGIWTHHDAASCCNGPWRHHAAGRRRAPDVASSRRRRLGHRQRLPPRAPGQVARAGEPHRRSCADRLHGHGLAGCLEGCRLAAHARRPAPHVHICPVRRGRRRDGPPRRRLEPHLSGRPRGHGRLSRKRHRQPRRHVRHQCGLRKRRKGSGDHRLFLSFPQGRPG